MTDGAHGEKMKGHENTMRSTGLQDLKLQVHREERGDGLEAMLRSKDTYLTSRHRLRCLWVKIQWLLLEREKGKQCPRGKSGFL